MPLLPLIAATVPLIDGVLDEPVWQHAPTSSSMVGFVPAPGIDDPGRTQVWLATDQNALYIAIKVQRYAPLNAPLVPRDDTLFNDWVGVLFDTFSDGQRAFTFRLGPSGVQADGIYVEGGDFWMQDLSWDTVWKSAGHTSATEWTAEAAIPWKSLRYPSGEVQNWRVLFNRFQPSPWTHYTWPEIPVDAPNILLQAATIEFRPPPRKGIPVEFLPTLTATYQSPPAGEHGIGTIEPVSGFYLDPGASGRIGISSGLTADLAFNPDFSQIESDADRVTANLKYPLEFQEKRPFFLESADLFETPLGAVYSRSIVDPLAGAKVSGRVGRMGLGIIGTLDERPAASTVQFDYASGESLPTWTTATVADRQAVNAIGRARWDLGEGGSVGVLASEKNLIGNQDILSNHVAGADITVPIGEQWETATQALVSYTDIPAANPLVGPAWEVEVGRSGEHFSFEVGHWGIGQGFRAENGFLEEVGRVSTSAVGTAHLRGMTWSRSLDASAGAEIVTDFMGQPTLAVAGGEWEMFFGRDGFSNGGLRYIRERFLGVDFDRWHTRGFTAISPTATTNFWVDWDIGPYPFYGAETADEAYLGFGWTPSAGGTVALFERLTLDYSATYFRFAKEAFGEPVYDGTLQRLKLNLNLNPQFSTRIIEEWNTFDDSLDSSLLFCWQENYASAVWLGGQESRDLGTDGGEVAVAEYAVFSKVSWLF